MVGLKGFPGRCTFCQKKVQINFQGMDFCGEKHLALYKEKMKVANRKLDGIKKCSTCGKTIRGKGVTLTGSYANRKFEVYKFCNGKCFDNMPDLEHPE